MFKSLASLIADSGLRGIDMNVRLMSDEKISVMLTFNQSEAFNDKLIGDTNDANTNANADAVIALRSALNTPLVIIAKPDNVLTDLEQALHQLREGVISATAEYSSLDISALLRKAVSSVKAANAKAPAAPKAANKASAPAPTATDDAPENDDGDSVETDIEIKAKAAPKKAATPKTDVKPEPKTETFSGFDAFDSI